MGKLRYHDYHLKGYRVSDFGNTIALDLIYDYPGHPLDESTIEFTDVILYHFIHTTGAIIIDIDVTPISKVLSDHAEEITAWDHQLGVAKWPGTIQGYENYLTSSGYLGWYIESAIGFQGFVIGKAVTQAKSV